MAAENPRPTPPPPPQISAVWRAILWKESREIVLIVGLIALLVGGTLGAMLAVQSWTLTSPRIVNNNYITAGDAFLNGAFTVMAALAALIVGFAQFIRESRPDRFGFLVHRPVSRAQLFWSKAAIGIGLYTAALLLLLGIALAWASQPFNIPLPFSWCMALPPVMDIVAGIPFYFAGVLIARRTESRWYGARLLPIAPPILMAIGNYALPHVGWGLLLTLAALLVLIPAAYGTYLAGGQYRSTSQPAKAALGLTTCAGILLAGGTAVGVTVSFLSQYSAENRVYYSNAVRFDQSGNPVILRQDYRYYTSNDESWYITDLQGNPMPKPQVPNRRVSTADVLLPMGQIYSTTTQYRDNSAHFPRHYFNFQTSSRNGTLWYLPVGDDADYLVGFQQPLRKRVGAIGANGLEPDVAVPQTPLATPVNLISDAFRNTSQLSSLLTAGDTLYRVTPEMKLEPLYKAPGIILRTGTLPLTERSGVDIISNDMLHLLQTQREIIVLPSAGDLKPLLRFPLAFSDQWSMQVGRIPATGNFLIFQNPDSMTNPGGIPHVYYANAQGAIDHEMELPKLHSSWQPYHGIADWVLAVLAPPVLIDMGIPSDEAQLQRNGYLDDPHVAKIERHASILAMSLSTTVGVLTAITLFLLSRRRRFTTPTTWLWTVLGLLLGPTAILTLLSTRGLGVIVRCTHCGTAVPVAADACTKCGTPQPAPAHNGTEIFSTDTPATA